MRVGNDGFGGLPVVLFPHRHGNLDWNVWGTHMGGTFAKATAIGGLPVPVAAFALSRPAGTCFPDLESRNPNRLHLISFRLAHTRACTRLGHLPDGRASFPARRHGIDPEPLDDGDAPVRRHEEPQHRLRLQHRADVASAAAGRGLRDGRHPDRRAGHLRRRPRLPHPRGRSLRLPAPRPERQSRDVRGRRRGPVQGVRGQTLLAPGQVLDDPAGDAVSRLSH